ncbi:MAG: flavodoxin [Lachnospiraceae bacterium]|nr:flavodoxin [Lachnospiraceae bacterium]
MKSAIVYYSMLGNCEMVAGKIAENIDADIIRIEPEKAYPDSGAKKFIWGGKSAVMGEAPKLKPYEFDASKYDRVIIGFPVWASNMAPPIRTFVKENLDSIKDKKIAVFACQGGNGAEKAFEKLKTLLGIEAFEAKLILIDPKTRVNSENDEKIKAFLA